MKDLADYAENGVWALKATDIVIDKTGFWCCLVVDLEYKTEKFIIRFEAV